MAGKRNLPAIYVANYSRRRTWKFTEEQRSILYEVVFYQEILMKQRYEKR